IRGSRTTAMVCRRRRAARFGMVRLHRRGLARGQGGARAQARPRGLDWRRPVSGTELEHPMVESVTVIGRGRVGSAIAARLEERGIPVVERNGELVLLAVPDTVIRDVARGLSPGQGWIGHVSGATPLSALDPHERRFSLHPLQTFTRSRGPEQLDGAWAAVTAESDAARGQALELARTLGLEPFELDDAERPLYHAGAAMASNFLVTLHEAAASLVAAA